MPRTLYDKLEYILKLCDKRPRLTADAVVAEIRRRQPDEFKVTYAAMGEKVTTISRAATIKQSVQLLVDLKLLTSMENCKLTNTGSQALADYSSTLGQAILNYLNSAHGISFREVRDEIVTIKNSPTKDVPSARAVYAGLVARNAFSNTVNETRFVRLMNLLGRCGLLIPNIVKFYWAGS
jgi:hypothetical protein